MSTFVKKLLLLAALLLGLGATAHPALAGDDTEATQTETQEGTEAQPSDDGTDVQPGEEATDDTQPSDEGAQPDPGDTTPSEE